LPNWTKNWSSGLEFSPKGKNMIWARAFVLLFFCLSANAVFAQAYCVTKPGVRLRKAANVKAPTTWRVPRYMPLSGTGKRSGKWVEVKDVDSQTHWVQSNEITTAKTCVVVRVQTSRLRQGPGRNFQASNLGLADRYMAFLDLGGEEGWTQIEDENGEKAWISVDHIWKPVRKTRLSFEGS
jgi:uncharacterized protein YgiM (DUF1202 family)